MFICTISLGRNQLLDDSISRSPQLIDESISRSPQLPDGSISQSPQLLGDSISLAPSYWMIRLIFRALSPLYPYEASTALNRILQLAVGRLDTIWGCLGNPRIRPSDLSRQTIYIYIYTHTYRYIYKYIYIYIYILFVIGEHSP